MQVRVESSTVVDKDLDSRLGLAVAFGADKEGGGWRVVVSHLSEGDVEPGWQTVAAEIGPVLVSDSVFDVAVRLVSGGHRMSLENLRAVIERCRPADGCISEGASFREGWSWLVGAALEGAARISSKVAVTGGVSAGYLVTGANSEEWLRTWSVGVAYRF